MTSASSPTSKASESSSPLPIALIIAAIGTLAAGGFVFSQLMAVGHAAYNTSNSGVFWGFAIVVYDFLLMISVGAAMVAGLSTVLRVSQFDGLAEQCYRLALATLIGGVAVLFLELGYPLRALYATAANMQVQSPLFWKVILIGIYALLLLALVFGSDSAPLATLAFILAVAIALVAGAVYGLVSFRPFWFGGGTIAGFLIQAFVAGLAAAVLLTHRSRVDSTVGSSLARLLLIALLLHLALVASRIVSGLYGNSEGLQVWRHLVATPLFHIGFWGGIVLPIVLLLSSGLREQSGTQKLIAVAVLAGLLIHHYEFIIGGQLVPLFKGSWVRGLIEYAPSPTEWGLLFTGVFVAWLVYTAINWRWAARE